MVFVKHNSLKSDIFFNPIFIPAFQGPGFSESRFFRVQVFQDPVFSVSAFGSRVQGPGSASRFRAQVLEVVIQNIFGETLRKKYS